MKSLISFLFIFSAFLASLPAQEPEFKKPMTMAETIQSLGILQGQSEISTPKDVAKGEIWALDSFVSFLGDPVQDKWVNETRTYFFYDSVINLKNAYSQIWYNDQDGWQNTYWHCLQYDNQNRKIEDWTKLWTPTSANYSNLYKYLYSYTDLDRVKTQYELYWKSNTQSWDTTFLLLNDFDSQNRIILNVYLKWNKIFNDWTNLNKHEHFYSDTSITTYYYKWDNSNSVWAPEANKIRIYDNSGLQIKEYNQVWDTEKQIYANNNHTIFIHDNNGYFLESVVYVWKNKWTPNIRWACLNNNDGNCIQELNQEWVVGSQKWRDVSITHYAYDDSGNEIESTTNEWNVATNSWLKYFKLQQFYSKKKTTIISQPDKNYNVNFLFPNPANDILYIKDGFEGVYLCINDFQGVSFLNMQLTGNQVNISNIPTGVYVATLKNENYIQSTKLVIR